MGGWWSAFESLSREDKTLWFTGVYTVASVITMGFLFWQVILLRRQIAGSARSSEQQLTQIRKQSDFVKEQITASTVSSEQQLRAYVTVKAASVRRMPGGGFEAQVQVVNSGQTPARFTHVWIQCSLEEFPWPTPLTERPAAVPNSGAGTLGPGVTQTLQSKPTRSFRMVEETAGIDRGTAALYVYGQFSYVDIFAQHRTTPFRLLHGGSHIHRLVDENHNGWWHLHPDDEGNAAD